jgi:hypothetical protein
MSELNLVPHIIAVAVLAVIVGGLALYRKSIASHEDDTVHLTGGGEAVQEQMVVASKLNAIDKWGKLLTILLVLYGLAVVGLYVWQMWEQSAKTPQFG